MKLGKFSKRSIRSAWHNVERGIVKANSADCKLYAISKITPKRHKALVFAAALMATGAQAKDCSVVRETYPIGDSQSQYGTGFVSYEKERVCYGQLANPEIAKSIEPTRFCFDLKNVTPSSFTVVTTLNNGTRMESDPFEITDAAMASRNALRKCATPWVGKTSFPASLKM